jgi:hypothetical protein
MPEISRSRLHFSIRWQRLFVAWHRGVSVTAFRRVGAITCAGLGLGIGTIEVSWGPLGRPAGR